MIRQIGRVEHMRRRELLLSGASMVLSSIARAQSGDGKPPRIAYLTAGAKAPRVSLLAAFSRGMKQLGLNEGRSYSLEARYAEGDFDRIPVLARELLGLNPDVFLVSTTPANLVAKQIITTTPIVMVAVADPIGVGLVNSFAPPGGQHDGHHKFDRRTGRKAFGIHEGSAARRFQNGHLRQSE